MATVIEILNKRGEVEQFYRFESESIEIGRGYENHLSIPDALLDETHLRIAVNDDGSFRIIDQGTVNGTKLHRKTTPAKGAQSVLDINSGDEISIGRSRIRIVNSKLAMAPPVKQVPEHKLSKLAKRPVSLAVLVTLTIFTLMYDQYADSITATTFSEHIMSLFQIGAVLLFVVSVFSLMAKAIRHQWYFLQNVFNICAFVVITESSSMLFDIIYFNLGFWQDKWVLDALALFALMLLGGWIFTFNLFVEKRGLRLVTVFSFATLVFAYSVIQGLADDQEFTKMRPVVTDRFSSWLMPYQPRLTDQEFISKSAGIFDKIEIEEE
jgi:pSer/pThr/pTyr-binding forkhead associated (FHA) protein